MKLRNLHKGLVLASILAVAAVVVLLSGNTGGSSSDSIGVTSISNGESASEDVMRQIDVAIGRAPQTAPDAVKGAQGTAAYDADFGRSTAGGGNSSSTAPAPAMAPIPGGVNESGGDPYGAATDRKIVQTASMRLQVKEVGGGFEEVGRIATGAGGFLASSSFSYEGDIQVAAATIRVPTARYQEVLGQLRSLGTRVDSEASNASDVTEEYTDLSARLRNLEATETQYLGFLAQAKNVSEVLQVQDRLNSTRSEIERVKGRMNLLDKLTDLSTITVHLRPVTGTGGGTSSGLGAEVSQAWDESLRFLESVAAIIINVVVFAWWVPFVAVPAYLAWTRFGRRVPPHAQVVKFD